MHRKNLAIVFGFLCAVTPFFGLTDTIETSLIVLFGLSVPFVLLFPRALSRDEKIEGTNSEKAE
jgi:hypothetical protein